MMLMTDLDTGDVMICELDLADALGGGAAEAASTMFGDRLHRYAAIASRAMWSPTAHGASSEAWCFAAVAATGGAALIFVKRDVEDARWWKIEPQHAPWFLLSSASSLRGALHGKPLVLKTVPLDDRRLLNRIGEGGEPPVDEAGLL